jgi:hypothetical protein
VLARTDAEACAKAAAAEGMWTEMHTDLNRLEGWGTTTRCVCIAPITKRFDGCLRSAGYKLVEPTVKRFDDCFHRTDYQIEPPRPLPY